MSEVKRYDPMGYDKMSGYMSEHAEGDYVRHDDYAALEAECQHLRQQLAERDAEIMEQCRLNGMGAERELKLIAQRDKLTGVLRKVLATHNCHTDDGEEAADEAYAILNGGGA